MSASLIAGAALDRPCGNAMHGRGEQWFASYEQDPRCQTCMARAVLAQHDHLHIGFNEEPCPNGEMVKCKCGAFHH